MSYKKKVRTFEVIFYKIRNKHPNASNRQLIVWTIGALHGKKTKKKGDS